MKFDYVIGNPPYQEEFTSEGNKTFAAPVYHSFMESAYDVSDCVELIHPARFLFDAGSTPKAWNKKMLTDNHFKVLVYEENANRMFSNTEIKGGVAISYRDLNRTFEPIEVFTPYKELQNILKKTNNGRSSLADIGVSGYAYHFTDEMHAAHPEVRSLQSKGHDYDLKSNVLEKLNMLFLEKIPDDGLKYLAIVGREKNERVIKYIKRSYINTVSNLDSYKLFLPKASGSGVFGEPLAETIVAKPGMGYTETFFSLGAFDNDYETYNLQKYLKTKFARTLLSVCKKTQMITPSTFKYVPIQDFTETSDVDWAQSIAEIDRQLYEKYDLSQEEIDFIETHVKEME